jgi:hypothetical protein
MRAAAVIVCAFLTGCGSQPSPVPATSRSPRKPAAPAKIDAHVDANFWSTWGDGKAEVSAYQLRKGTAVAIFIAEQFSNSLRVKAEPGRHGPGDEFPVMKLNLIKDYRTGIYDYNDMLSAFISLAPVNNRPAATPAKISFSSQEWSGHVFSQMLFGDQRIRVTQHSYFDGEGDRQRDLSYPDWGTAEDTLLLWARGMAEPWMKAGVPMQRLLLTSLETSRAKHIPLAWSKGTLSVDRQSQRIETRAGAFDVEIRRVKRSDGTWLAIYVEKAPPKRIIKWETSEGEKAELLGSDRLKYWELNNEGAKAALKKLGISRATPTPEQNRER